MKKDRIDITPIVKYKAKYRCKYCGGHLNTYGQKGGVNGLCNICNMINSLTLYYKTLNDIRPTRQLKIEECSINPINTDTNNRKESDKNDR